MGTFPRFDSDGVPKQEKFAVLGSVVPVFRQILVDA